MKEAKTGQLILVIGGTGQRKTTFIKEVLLKGGECLVYDVNAEYGQQKANRTNYVSPFDPLPIDANLPRSRWFGDMSDFLNIVPFKHNGCKIVFEEATNFFEGKTGKVMKSICTGKRHPEELGGRNLIFVFHTIQSVPPFLFGMANTVCLFKTNDTKQQVKSKCERLLPAFIKLQTLPNCSRINVPMQ